MATYVDGGEEARERDETRRGVLARSRVRMSACAPKRRRHVYGRAWPLGWVGSRGLGSIGHSYGNVSNYRTELLARPEDPVR